MRPMHAFMAPLALITWLVATGCTERPATVAPKAAPTSAANTTSTTTTTAPASASTTTAATTSAAPITDQWLGQWTGPEGTSLQLAGGHGAYDLTIRNLDGPRAFKGTAVGDRIEFERDGVKESIRATNGAATGMKWLSGKSNCLTVRAGEGYCRD